MDVCERHLILSRVSGLFVIESVTICSANGIGAQWQRWKETLSVSRCSYCFRISFHILVFIVSLNAHDASETKPFTHVVSSCTENKKRIIHLALNKPSTKSCRTNVRKWPERTHYEEIHYTQVCIQCSSPWFDCVFYRICFCLFLAWTHFKRRQQTFAPFNRIFNWSLTMKYRRQRIGATTFDNGCKSITGNF